VQAVARGDDRKPKDSLKTLGVWLILVAATVMLVIVVRVDSSREDSPALRVKSARPVVVKLSVTSERPSKTPIAPPTIRVNLTPGGESSLQLEIRGPYTVRRIGGTRELGKGARLAPAKVVANKTEIRIGSVSYPETQLEVVSKDDPGMRVNNHLYRGVIRLCRRTDGLISAVNVLPMEEYLASVVDSEMPAAFPEAARQAQAIVSRTYALYQKEHADPAAVYDLFSTQRSQKYLGVEYTTDSGRRLAGESASSRAAVAAPRGMVCMKNAKLFCTYYSAVCGGRTTSGAGVFADASDLISVPCEWCHESDHYRWTVPFERADFSKKTQQLTSLPKITSVRQTAGPGTGVISRFRLADGAKTAEANGIELRDRLGLRSPHFALVIEKDKVRAEGRGHGHGVGFCQWGARGQGLAGKTVKEIVAHYYPGTELKKLDY
jgi:stage II sporulation protein D